MQVNSMVNAAALCVLLVLSGHAAADEQVDPRNANWQIELEAVWGVAKKKNETVSKDLNLSLNVTDGKMSAGVGYAPRFNRAGHRVDDAKFEFDGDRVAIEFDATMFPDRWVPSDGKAIDVQGHITGKLKKADDGTWSIDGEYHVSVGGTPLNGKVDGRVEPATTPQKALFVGRLFPVKIDDRDFPEMELLIRVDDGKLKWGRLGMSWQRWPHRWHAFDASKLTYDRKLQTIHGKVVVLARAVDVTVDEHDAKYELHFDGAQVGNMYVTRIENGIYAYAPAEDYMWMFEVDDQPWWTPVKEHREVKRGEHPRVLFRRDEVREIRRRAGTDEGKRIVARLRRLLDGRNGDTLPTKFNKTAPHNHKHSDTPKNIGEYFTSFHAPGYAMLYQLTGEKKYADLARQAVELMFDGAIDIDNRYAWFKPGTDLRVGTLLMSVGLTYDLAYDGWDEKFRRKVAEALQDYDMVAASGNHEITVRHLMGRTGYPPASNHYGSHFGGTLLAMLAIKDDPGVDSERVEQRIAEGLDMIPNFFHYGFGEGGWYQEGPHPSRLSTNGGFLSGLQATKNVLGRDYISARPNGQFATLRWVYWLTADSAGRPVFLNRGTYGSDSMYGRAPMVSHSADFAFGFGTVADKYKPAVEWTYDNFVASWDRGPARPHWTNEGEESFTAFFYPMQAVFALVNWPVDSEPVNPGKLLPKHHVDKVNDYFVSRNHWQDRNDIVVTFSTGGGPWGYHRAQGRGSVHLRAYGQKITLPGRFGHAKPYAHAAAEDGSFTLGCYGYFGYDGGPPSRSALAVDLSGKSGADLVIVQAYHKPDKKKLGVKKDSKGIAEHHTMLDGKDGWVFLVSTIDREAKPDVKVKDNNVTVGGQTYEFDGKVIAFNGLRP